MMNDKVKAMVGNDVGSGGDRDADVDVVIFLL